MSGGGDDGGGRQIQSLDMSRSVGERRTEAELDAYCSRFNSLHMQDPSVLIGSSCRLYTRWSMCLCLFWSITASARLPLTGVENQLIELCSWR